MSIKVFLDDNRCKYLLLNSDRNSIEINDSERENILQLIEEHAHSIEDLQNDDDIDEEEYLRYNKYLATKRKSLTCEEIVNKVNQKYEKREQRSKEVTGIIEEDEDDENNELNNEEDEDIGDEDNEEDNNGRTRRRSSQLSSGGGKDKKKKEGVKKSHGDFLEKKFKKPNLNKKRDIVMLDLDDLKKSKEEQVKVMEKSNSVDSSESDFQVDEYLKKRTTFFFPWKAIYATEGPWRPRLLSRPLELDIIYKVYADLKSMQANGKEFMCNNIMAQVLDLAHPSHQLQNLLLTYPLSASNILKKRLLNLGYKLVIPIIHEEISTFTVDTSLYIMSQVIRKVEREMRFYFEVNASDNAEWRIGNIL